VAAIINKNKKKYSQRNAASDNRVYAGFWGRTTADMCSCGDACVFLQ